MTTAGTPPAGRLDSHTGLAAGVSAPPTEIAIHAALVRAVLTFGVERHVLALESTLCLAIVFGAGVHAVTLILVAVVVVVLHPTMAWVTARDPQATAVYVRSCIYADYYAPHAPLHARRRAPAPTIPQVR